MLRRGLVSSCFVIPFFVSIIYAKAFADEPILTVTTIITAIRTGGVDTKDQEFVELYNATDAEVDVSGWKIKYAAAGTAGSGTTKYTMPSDTRLAPSEYLLVATSSYISDNPAITSRLMNSGLNDDGGHIILTDSLGAEIDRLGWGSAQYPKILAAVSPSVSGQSLKRCSASDTYMNSGDNSFDFALVSSPLHFEIGPSCGVESDGSDVIGDSEPGVTCEGVIITELLPNVAGSDSGNEYIELHNPTNTTISLNGCSLQTTANSKVYAIGDTEIKPGQYVAFYDSQTGLTLPNTAGGTVWLLSPTEELQSITYPGDLEDDVTWALFGDSWIATYQNTPNTSNILVAIKPCLYEGQIRNPETNRCYDPYSYTYILKPCAPGQERNPQTNRCRNISASALVPCKPGQERNPVTNRCRKIGGSSLKPCAAGQIRNPETNRCRKAPAGQVAGISTVKDIESAEISAPVQWGIAAAVGLGAIGFGLYEWRHDILHSIRRIRGRI